MLLKMFREMVADMSIYTNIYVIADEKTKLGAIIDPGGAIDKIANHIENMQITPKYVILTHCHADHIAGLKKLREYYPSIKIIIHEKDIKGLTDSKINQVESVGTLPNYIEADIAVEDGDIIEIGELKAKVMHTPGHTAGSMCILLDDAIFTGDTMFKRMCGRVDFPTGNEEDMKSSLKKILTLPENTIIYPGHGPMSIIREEIGRYDF